LTRKKIRVVNIYKFNKNKYSFIIKYAQYIVYWPTHSSKINGSRNDMNVHQIVNDASLYVTFVLAHQHFFSSIEYLHKAQLRLGHLVQWFVTFLIMLYPLQKVPKCHISTHALVVRAVNLHFLRNKSIDNNR